MNFDDYEKTHQIRYAEFANTIKLILEKAIEADEGVPRPQSVQCRAKSAASLKPKLAARDLLETDRIEAEIKDLAGARLIFYTNTDVDQFLNSQLIPQNFYIHSEATKIHHPLQENGERRYRAIHYTVSLSENRTKLAEYGKFGGMRCEIQIHTILNHAWSETSHDILYKEDPRTGFGTRAMKSIKDRLNQIMDEYLLPADFEFQKVQHDYKRLQQGKELFDRDAVRLLEAAQTNNERYELLSSLKEYALPNYDDISAIYRDLRDPLVKAAIESRATMVEPIITPFGSLDGHTAEDVVSIIVDIFEALRYWDVERTFAALGDIYRDEPNGNVRKRIRETVKRLAEYNLDVWEQAGLRVQFALVVFIECMGASERVALRDLLLIVWAAVLDSGISGTTRKADAVTLRSGALPVSKELKSVRDKALSGLFDLFDKSATLNEQRDVIDAMRAAMHVPVQANYSNQLLAMTVSDSKKITDFLGQCISRLPFELLEHIEYFLLDDYRFARGLVEDEQDSAGCRQVSIDLMTSIETFRDAINGDETFVRYKTLVGYESVFPPHWTDNNFNYIESEGYRQERLSEFIENVSENTENEWYSLIERCAATESNDSATFPVFGDFLYRLSKEKPEIAGRILERADEPLLKFLQAFLKGFNESNANAQYQAALAQYLRPGICLPAIARHFRFATSFDLDLTIKVLNTAISSGNEIAVIECMVLAMERADGTGSSLLENIFLPAISYLSARADSRWIRGAWSSPVVKTFLTALSANHAALVLQNLLALPKIDHEAERILGYIAERHPALVWEFFIERLARGREDETAGYKPFPYRFFGLELLLGAIPEIAIERVRRSCISGDSLFRLKGGRLLSTAFPGCSEAFARCLTELATAGSDDDVAFVLGVMANYRGQPSTHTVLQAVVNRLPDGDPQLAQVRFSLNNTGNLAGEFGSVQAFRTKKEEIAPWLEDLRPRVKAFAEDHLRRLDLEIASQQRSAEAARALRNHEFGGDGDSGP